MSLRTRLAIGYSFLFCTALLLLGAGLYQILRGALFDEVDRALRDRAAQVERAARSRDEDDLSVSQLSADIFVLTPASAGEELKSPGIIARVIDLSGRTMVSSSSVAMQLPSDEDALARATRGEVVIQTTSVAGAPVRVLYHPLRLSNGIVAVIQVAESLRPMENTLDRTRRLMLLGGAVAITGGIFGGWWLTRKALEPVVELTDAVARIASTGEFDQRVPESAKNDEIGRLAATFNVLLERLNELLDRQRALVADTSHELRNPLMVVRGNLELLALDPSPEDRREAIQDAIEEVDRMSRLVADLLFLADADTTAAIEHEHVELASVVDAVVADARLLADRQDGVRVIELEANDPLVIHGDTERLRQLVWNLVENAVRYTPAGGTVTVASRDRGTIAELTVADTGIGIPAEHLPHIFERFYRVDTGRSRQVGGTGLGLSIVRQVAEAHGGQVRVRSTVGQGTTFTVVLPVSPRPPEPTPTAEEAQG
jgi:heavy metal sensor kinase